MARNRQRAKERQARRKAREQQGAGDGAATDGGVVPAPEPHSEPPPAPDEPERPEPEPEAEAKDDAPVDDPVLGVHLQAGAPPEDVGRSDEVLDYEQDLDGVDRDEDHFDLAEDMPEEDLAPGPKGRRGDPEKHKDRPRFVQFLFAVWAELQRVQWPDRQALTTLTGVVLGFVLIAGGYLGLLDAIFSRIIQAIL